MKAIDHQFKTKAENQRICFVAHKKTHLMETEDRKNWDL
jgi:hypothetical protein